LNKSALERKEDEAGFRFSGMSKHKGYYHITEHYAVSEAILPQGILASLDPIFCSPRGVYFVSYKNDKGKIKHVS
jgi:hypothetical protein